MPMLRADWVEPTVVHVNSGAYDVYIGRGSKWGNPFRMGVHGDRYEVIARYRSYILRRPDLLRSLPELSGKRLGCHCAPAMCHGDLLVTLFRERLLT